ncbi:hypothetical protein DM860_011185 [Cuscuta australis]|uniref:Uncharacterized protein n=1 Tax=Cuscuta australis TaxID=267555 RepID=A0A328D9S3_9ASTE|nr:hypothetical protein DM860_011185 [Cuscuta australis]
MHRVVKRKINGQKPTVLFNDKGQPYGVAVAEMQSYIGVLARTKAPIWFDTWRQVPVTIKNKIWKSVTAKTHSGDESVIDRSVTWVLARKDKEGNFKSDSTKQKAEEIKTQTTVDEQVKEGVRQLLAEEVNNIVASRDAFWMAEIEKLKSEIWKKQGSSPAVPSQEASCSPKFREGGQNQQVARKNLKDSFDALLEPLTENNDIGDECNHKLSVAEHVDEKQNEKEREKNESEDQEIDTVEKLVEVGGLNVTPRNIP